MAVYTRAGFAENRSAVVATGWDSNAFSNRLKSLYRVISMDGQTDGQN